MADTESNSTASMDLAVGIVFNVAGVPRVFLDPRVLAPYQFSVIEAIVIDTTDLLRYSLDIFAPNICYNRPEERFKVNIYLPVRNLNQG